MFRPAALRRAVDRGVDVGAAVERERLLFVEPDFGEADLEEAGLFEPDRVEDAFVEAEREPADFADVRPVRDRFEFDVRAEDRAEPRAVDLVLLRRDVEVDRF